MGPGDMSLATTGRLNLAIRLSFFYAAVFAVIGIQVPFFPVWLASRGMDPAQMEGYLTYRYEYHFLYISGIEHVESKSIQGASIMKLQFHPGTDMSQAMSETVAQVNRSRAFMPLGTVAPFIMRFDAGSVAVGYLVFSTDDPNITLNQMQDQALNRVRPAFATLPGVSAPPPLPRPPAQAVVPAGSSFQTNASRVPPRLVSVRPPKVTAPVKSPVRYTLSAPSTATSWPTAVPPPVARVHRTAPVGSSFSASACPVEVSAPQT